MFCDNFLSSTRNSDGATVSSTSNIVSTVTTDGYYTESNGTVKVLNGTTTSWVENISGWTDASSKWTKTSTATVYAKCGSHSERTLPTITKSGYICGWTTSSTGTTIMYASGGTMTPSSNTTLYGVCVANPPLQQVYGTQSATSKFLSTTIPRNQIESVSFANTLGNHTANGTDCWDVGATKNGTVLAWAEDNDSG